MTDAMNYLNKEGKIKCWPAKQDGKAAVAIHLGRKFDIGRFYTEKDVNRIVEENHTFGDYFLLRREMIERGVMRRTPDGARYWRGGLWANGNCSTERLTVAPAMPADHGEIRQIYFSCSDVGNWIGEPHTETALKALLDGTDLPPDGQVEFNHIAVIREKNSGSAVGLLQYYTAWPGANCLWIGLFLLDPQHRHMGYGSECIGVMLAEARRQGYRRTGLGVALRNQAGIKFWVKCGFSTITKVAADGDSGEGTLGLLGLSMEL